MDPTSIFGPLDLLYPHAAYVLFVLVLLNAITRQVAHRRHVSQYEEGGAEAVARFTPHTISNALLFLAAVYYTTVKFEAGTIVVVLVIGVIITDFFEFEARKAEARTDRSLDVPKGALTAWAVAATYISYKALRFIVDPLWGVIGG
ncbi:hypothetical protein L593_03265 [Salinarchaeum sp. Harcht-Bsk1]|uniref:DUF7313 family protein n=1 Tax=Salinarchaeum sp. Harcht-Bsk1 TaxID=1333523 RepID=UPI00034248BB|nr:hypothetical protein [Salinarchaeum sp. Harcht-Bsk1]AGN00604.1 hypothetical protein L593_03265 [Salinarchaeum sp. Harcht-Bsk1]